MTPSQLYDYVIFRQSKGFIVYLDEAEDNMLMDYAYVDSRRWSKYIETLLFALERGDDRHAATQIENQSA